MTGSSLVKWDTRQFIDEMNIEKALKNMKFGKFCERDILQYAPHPHNTHRTQIMAPFSAALF
jgi:hypothetical protein